MTSKSCVFYIGKDTAYWSSPSDTLQDATNNNDERDLKCNFSVLWRIFFTEKSWWGTGHNTK